MVTEHTRDEHLEGSNTPTDSGLGWNVIDGSDDRGTLTEPVREASVRNRRSATDP